jgi:Ca2+-binding EF-hand superfamily protein
MTTMMGGGGGETATVDQISELREVFAKFHPQLQTSTDAKGDETAELVITANELGVVMRKLNVEVLPNELADMIEDADGGLKGHEEPDGALDFPEFIGMMSRKLNDPHSKQELQDAFQVFDADNNGFISAKELCNVMNNLGIDLPNEDGSPMSEAEVADLICDWGPPDRNGRRERRPGMSWDRFWSEIQGGAEGFGKKKKKRGRSKAAEETVRLAQKAQLELKRAKEAVEELEGHRQDESEDEFNKRKKEAEEKVTKAEQKYEALKAKSEEDPEEIQVTRLDIKRFAAQDNLSAHDAVRLGLGAAEQIEKTMRTRTFLGKQFLTQDAAQMARRYSIRLAAESGMDRSGAIDLSEIKGALQEFDLFGDQSVFLHELGIVCEVLQRRPMKNTLNSQVEMLQETKIDPNAPWSCVGTPPWAGGAAGCRCVRPFKSAGYAVDPSASFVGCEHDATNFTISMGLGRDGCAANPQARHEKHTSKCLHDGEKWSTFCARRAGIHGYGSSSDSRRQLLSWRTGRVPGSSCGFCCVNIKAGAGVHRWQKSADGNGWVEPAERDEVHERLEEEHDPAGLWAHIFPCGAEWRAGNGFPNNIEAICEDCGENHARYGLTNRAKQIERLEYKRDVEELEDKRLQHRIDDAADEAAAAALIHEAEKAKSLAETRLRATEAADRESRMRWCESCMHAQQHRFEDSQKDGSFTECLEDVEQRIEKEMVSFMRRRKPQKLLQEIRRTALVFQAKTHHGEIRDRLLRRRVLEEDKKGFTPMHCAARDGKLECVQALLVHASTKPSETMVPVGKSIAYTWDPSIGTAYKLDPPQDADRRPGLRHPDYDVWPTSTTLSPSAVRCGTQEGQGDERGRGITDDEIQEIMDSTGATIIVPERLNTDSGARMQAEQGPDATSSTEAGPTVIEIQGSCHAELDGCEPPIAVAKRKLNALRHKYYVDWLRKEHIKEHAQEKRYAEEAKEAKTEKTQATDAVVHLERTMRNKTTPKLEEELKALKETEKEKEAILDEKRLIWHTCMDQQRRELARIAEAEVDMQMMQPSVFETPKGSLATLAAADIMGFTPLHWACRRGHTAVALLLIAEGAQPTALTLKGRTPLEEAEAFDMDEVDEAEELSKLNGGSDMAKEVTALRAAEKQRRDCVAELKKQCPLMADDPMDAGTPIYVDGYGLGSYVARKKKASGGFCGRGALSAVHIVRIKRTGEEHQLHLKEMGWRLPSFKPGGNAGGRSASPSAFDSLAMGGTGKDSDGLPAAEPEPPLPGGVPDTPSKYRAEGGRGGQSRAGKKLEV